MPRRPATFAILALALASSLAAGTPAVAAPVGDAETIRQCLAAASDSPPRSCIGQISKACQDGPEGGTTIGSDACVSREGDAWDSLLNKAYQAEMESAKALDGERKSAGDAEATAAADLLKAQRAWIAYRDAECDRRFEVYKDGTIRTTMALSCILDLTALRAMDLGSQE